MYLYLPFPFSFFFLLNTWCYFSTSECQSLFVYCLFVSSQTFGESVSSVAGGNISSSSTLEVIVSTYSGQVHGLTKINVNKPGGAISSEVKAKIETLWLV